MQYTLYTGSHSHIHTSFTHVATETHSHKLVLLRQKHNPSIFGISTTLLYHISFSETAKHKIRQVVIPDLKRTQSQHRSSAIVE